MSGPILTSTPMLKASSVKHIPAPFADAAAYRGKTPLVARDVVAWLQRIQTLVETKRTERNRDTSSDCKATCDRFIGLHHRCLGTDYPTELVPKVRV